MSTHRRIALGCITWLLAAALTAPLFGQVQNGSLTGLVTDPSGAAVAGATVTATNENTNAVVQTITDSAGYYLFASLPIGSYTISVEKNDFKKAVQDNAVLEISSRVRADFGLQVGPITQVVNVKATQARLETQQASPSTVIRNDFVSSMPLSQRNWDDLLGMVAGVAGDRYTEQSASTAAGRTGGVNVHGVRSLQNNFLLDGVDNNTISENVQELSSQAVHTSVDALEEFKVITDPYSAEYGRSPGAAIIAATKSGTNQYHGTLWEFLRNDKFDAADFFTNRSAVKKGENRTDYFGGNVGGPIKKDRAFFFFNYEGQRIKRGQLRLTNVPTANERAGDFSPAAAAANNTTYATIYDRVGDCRAKSPASFNPDGSFINNQIPAACIDTESQNIVTRYLPNANLIPASGPLNTNDFIRVPLLIDDNDTYTGRGDGNVTENNHVFLRYIYSNRYRFVPGAFGGIIDGTGSSALGRYLLKAHELALGWTSVLSPRMLNEVRIGWSRNDSSAQQDPFGKNTLASAGILGVADSPIYDGGLPGMSISGGGGVPTPANGGGLGRLGSPDFLPKFQKTNQFEGADTLNLSRGSHQFKLGADFHLPMRDIYLDVPGVRGSWGFNGQYTRNPATGSSRTGIPWADFLLGYPQNAQLTNLAIFDERIWMSSFFFQDEWKFSPRLTVNYGIRYDYATWPHEARNKMTNLNAATGATFTSANSPFGNTLVRPDKMNFAPRLGLAYQVGTNWVLRAGYGRFYQLFERIGSEDQMEENLPWEVNNVVAGSSTVPAGNGTTSMRVATGFNLSLDPNAILANPIALRNVRVRAVNPNSVHASIDQWNFGFQYLLGQSATLTVDYVGTKGTHLTILRQLNQEFLNANNSPTTTLPYPSLGPIEYRDDMGNSTYNGLEVTLDKHFSHGLSLHTAYNWSHSIDWVVDNLFSGGSGSIVPDSYNVKGTNRGNSDFDFRQWFSVGYVYQVPRLFKNSLGDHGPIFHALRDWRISGFTSARSGRPFSIYGNNNKGTLDIRGNLISDVYADCLANGALSASGSRTVRHWFNTADYVLPSPARMGTCGRNILFGPDLVQFDFNLTRTFNYFGEGRHMEFRWDLLNAFNNAHFGLPGQDVSSGTFGQITSLSGDPRVMQFALKFSF